MLILFLRYLTGYLRIRVEGYSPERFLNLCSHHGIYLWNLKPCGHAYEMNIRVSSFKELKPVIKKSHTKVSIQKRIGFPFLLHRYRRRRMFFAGFFFCLAGIYILSLFIWNIHIEGNLFRTDEVLLEFLESKHIVHGMRRSEIDCSRIVKDLRKEYDDIIWVSAYVRGTRLMIQVKENTDRTENQKEPEEAAPSDIISDKDGTVLQLVTRKGIPQIHEGDHIKKGDLLISGTVEIRNDAGEVTACQYQNADAQILAQTEQCYEDTVPLYYEKKCYTGKKRYCYWIDTGKNRFLFGGTGSRFSNASFTASEIHPRIGEHFRLPFSFGIQTIREYTPKQQKYTEKEYRTLLSNKFQKFSDNLEKKGVQILENNVKIYREADHVRAKGTLVLAEQIGIRQPGSRLDVPDQKKNSPDEEQEGN